MTLPPATTDLVLPIYSERLMLRPLQAGDGLATFEACKESWDELFPWGIWTLAPYPDLTPEIYEAFCCKKSERFVAREDLTFLVQDKETGKMIGISGLHHCDWEQRVFSLGYWVRSSQIGKGYATEIAQCLIDFAFGNLQANKIISHHAAGNRKSQRVLEKCGFSQEGILKSRHTLPDQSLVDEYSYSLPRSFKMEPS